MGKTKEKTESNRKFNLDFFRTLKPVQMIFPVILALSVFSYYIFSTYKPNISETSTDVSETQYEYKIPLLLNSEIISENKTTSTQNITLKTKISPEMAIEFYDSVLKKSDWEIESEGSSDGFISRKYKRERDKVEISAAKQTESMDEQNTIVTIDYEIY